MDFALQLWPTRVMDDQIYTLWDNSRTQGTQMVLLNLMVLQRWWPGLKLSNSSLQSFRSHRFMTVVVDTESSWLIYDDFSHHLFLHDHREESVLSNGISEESGQFRFLHTTWLVNLKGCVWLSGVDFGERFDYEDFCTVHLSSRSFVSLPCFIRSRCPTPLLDPSLVFSPPCFD